jgi:hypothetical protein
VGKKKPKTNELVSENKLVPEEAAKPARRERKDGGCPFNVNDFNVEDAKKICAALSIVDPADFVEDADGTIVDFHDLDYYTRIAISRFEVYEEFDSTTGRKVEKVRIGFTKKLGREERLKALELWAKFTGNLNGGAREPNDKLDELIAVMNHGPVKRKKED